MQLFVRDRRLFLKIEVMENLNHIFADRTALPDIIIHTLSEDGCSTSATSIVEEAEEDYEDSNGGTTKSAENQWERSAPSVILWTLRIFLFFLVIVLVLWFIWAPKLIYNYYYIRN